MSVYLHDVCNGCRNAVDSTQHQKCFLVIEGAGDLGVEQFRKSNEADRLILTLSLFSMLFSTSDCLAFCSLKIRPI